MECRPFAQICEQVHSLWLRTAIHIVCNDELKHLRGVEDTQVEFLSPDGLRHSPHGGCTRRLHVGPRLLAAPQSQSQRVS